MRRTRSGASSAKPCKRKSQRRTGDFPPGAVQSFLFRVPYGSRPGSGLKLEKRAGIIQRGIKEKVSDFIRNQKLFGGDCWTRTSDLLRVKIRQGRRERPIPPVSSRLPLFDRRRWQISSHTLRCLRPRFSCSGSGSESGSNSDSLNKRCFLMRQPCFFTIDRPWGKQVRS